MAPSPHTACVLHARGSAGAGGSAGQPPGEVPTHWPSARTGEAVHVPSQHPGLTGTLGTRGEAGSGGCLPAAEGQGRNGGDVVPNRNPAPSGKPCLSPCSFRVRAPKRLMTATQAADAQISVGAHAASKGTQLPVTLLLQRKSMGTLKGVFSFTYQR